MNNLKPLLLALILIGLSGMAFGEKYEGKITVICKGCKIIVPKTGTNTIIKTRTVYKANLMFLHLGVGKNGVKVTEENETLIVEEKKVPLIGLTYARHITNGFYIGASGFSNSGMTATFGLSW
jgi:hypothetical protein